MVQVLRPKEVTLEYKIIDRNCHEMSGQIIIAGQATIRLTPIQAKFFLANGSIVPVMPNG